MPATIILIGNVTIAMDIILRKKRLNKTHPTCQLPTIELQQQHTSSVESSQAQRRVVPGNQFSQRNVTVGIQNTTITHMNLTSVETVSHSNNYTGNPISKQPSSFHKAAQNNRPSAHVTTRNVKTRSPSRMLFTLTIFFVVTSFPFTCYSVAKSQISDLNGRDVSRWQLLTIIVLILGWCNATFNFFLYFVSGTLFKREWERLVQSGKLKCCRLFNR
jgi:hypothetical protein